jgi:TrwC relaxase
LSDPGTSSAVRAAHDRAVAEGLAYLERHAAFARRGAGGERRIETSGLVAAAFVHRTSRTGDLQLHTHVLAANAVLGIDGRWSSPDASGTVRRRSGGFRLVALPVEEWDHRSAEVIGGAGGDGGLHHGAVFSPVVPDHKAGTFRRGGGAS